MDQHDFEIDAGEIQPAHGGGCSLRDRPHPDSTAYLAPVPNHDARRGEAGDPDLHATARDDDVGRVHQRVARALEDVGGDVMVRGVSRGARQHRRPEVEFVIAGSGRVVLHRVERVYHGVGAL